jgi:hypothetical protein
MINYPIKCAVCRITVVGSIEIKTKEDYPGDEKCALICDACVEQINKDNPDLESDS